MPEKNNEEIQEMQILDQNLHTLVLQKQAFEMELLETKSALQEIEKSPEIYRMIGELMIKSDREKVKEGLLNKEKIISMRIKSIEKQEDVFSRRLDELRRKLQNNAK